MEEVIEILKEYGFIDSGTTRINSFRTASHGHGGGSVVTLGGRLRFTRGNWLITVGKRTTCISLKPDEPETIPGRGRLIGQDVMTFRDWIQVNIPTKNVEEIRKYLADEVGK